MEQWKPVLDWEEAYEVSSLGNVRRIARGHGTYPGRLLKLRCNNRGYPYVILSYGGALKNRLAHTLVAEAFIGPCPPTLEVNHKDGKPTNNTVDNLEYVTRPENHRHSYATLGKPPMRGARNGRAKLTEKQAVELVRLHFREGKSRAYLAGLFGVSHQLVARIVTGKTWSILTRRQHRP